MIKFKESGSDEPQREYDHVDSYNLREVASPNVFRIDVHYPAPGRTCCYLITEGDKAALVDCGARLGADLIMTVLHEKGIAPQDVEWLFLTHPHLDHAGAAGRLMRLLPRVIVAAHPSTIKHLISPDDALLPAVKALYGETFYEQHFAGVEPLDKIRAHALADGEYLAVGNIRAVRAIYSPGHAWNHVSFYDSSASFLFSGDAYGISYPALNNEIGAPLILPTTPPSQLDFAAMEKSLNLLRRINAKFIGLTHFGAFPASDDSLRQLLDALGEWRSEAEKLWDAHGGDDFHRRFADYMLEWVVTRAFGLTADKTAFLRDYLQGDANLNAHGIQHWIKKQRSG